jgi:hypothetical protein
MKNDLFSKIYTTNNIAQYYVLPFKWFLKQNYENYCWFHFICLVLFSNGIPRVGTKNFREIWYSVEQIWFQLQWQIRDNLHEYLRTFMVSRCLRH